MRRSRSCSAGQLRITEREYLKTLMERLDEPEGVGRYLQPEPFVPDEGRLLPAPIAPFEATPSLACATPGSTKEEADNAARIYRWLKDLTPVQASDPRLWATLTHTHFWAYVGRRWPGLAKSAENPANYITEHWFTLGSGKAGLRRNAISRLWWAARLTLSPWEDDPGLECFRTEDPARFTKILLSNAQISFDLLERDYGSSCRIRCDAVGRLVDRRDEPRHLHVALLAEDVKTPSAVLSAAPGQQHIPPTTHDSTNEVRLPLEPRCTSHPLRRARSA